MKICFLMLWWIGQLKFCPVSMNFEGQCSLGVKSCFDEFLTRLGTSVMPSNCMCFDLPENLRRCTCDIVCGQ